MHNNRMMLHMPIVTAKRSAHETLRTVDTKGVKERA